MGQRNNKQETQQSNYPEYIKLLQMMYSKSMDQRELKQLLDELNIEFVADPVEQLMLISEKAELFPELLQEEKRV